MRPPPSRELAVVAFLALAAAAAPARAELPRPAAAGGGALRISADPPQLLLGRDGGAELRIAAPPDVEDVVLSASVGRVEGVRRVPGVGFAARFKAPPERFPQVAIVSALGRGPRGTCDGWVAVPLYGQGEAKVRAEPGSEITLRIGDRTFGPRPAGADGVAVIPVVVPPGVREAHHGFRPIDLHVPETPLVHAAIDRVVVQADRPEQIHVTAYVVAPHGAARRGDTPVFETTRGTITAAAREPGAFEGTWTVPPGMAGEERLVVRLPGAPASRSVLRIETVPGPPSSVAVAFDRDALVAGEAEEVVVSARVVDAAGNIAAGNAASAEVVLHADGGVLSDPVAAGPGQYTARLRVAPRFGDRSAIVVSARAADAGIGGSRALPLRAGPPVTPRVAPASAVVVGDGDRLSSLEVSVFDRFDNPVSVAPTVRADRGRITGVSESRPGTYLVGYVPPAVTERSQDRVHVDVGGASGDAEVVLVPRRARIGAVPYAGVAFDARGRFAAPHAAVALDVDLDTRSLGLAPAAGLSLRLEADVIGFSRDAGASRGRRGDGRLSTRAGALLAGAVLRRELAQRAQVWGSVAVGALLAATDPGDAAARTGGAPAARLAVGVGWPRRSATPFVEAGVLAAGDASPGAFAAFTVSGGIRFDVEP